MKRTTKRIAYNVIIFAMLFAGITINSNTTMCTLHTWQQKPDMSRQAEANNPLPS